MYRQLFKRFNPFMLLMWRLGLGKWVNCLPCWVGRIMVISHRGRRSGMRRYTPVNYALIEGELYCTAGFGKVADWYRNIMADPEVEVWLPDEWWTARVKDISESPYRIPIMRQVLINSGFAAPLMGLHPGRMDDETLAAETSEYRLLHLKRIQPQTGKGGPGDLAWVWQAATVCLLFLLIRRSRR